MKKLLKVTALSTLLLSSSSTLLADTEKNFQYTYTPTAKVGGSITGLGLLSVATGGIAMSRTIGKTAIDRAGWVTLGVVAVRVGAGIGAIGLVTLAYEGFSQLKEIDKQLYIKEYAALKSVLTTAMATGILPQNTEALKLISSFTCENCNSALETVQKFALVFSKVDEIAKDLVKSVDFSHDELDAGIDSELVEASLKKVLGSDDTIENLKITKRLLMLASVNALIVEEK